MKAKPVPSDPDAKERLVRAGLEVFGELNLEGATTRELARRGGVNQAAIPYHFGGKEGLYLAVVQFIAGRIREGVLPAAQEIPALFEAGRRPSRAEALAAARKIFGAFLGVLVGNPAAAAWARIVMREQMQPTAAFDFIYENVVRHVHSAVASLLAAAHGGRADDPAMILRAHAVIGQMLGFLSGRSTILRRLGWKGYTPEEGRQIERALGDNLEAIFLYQPAPPPRSRPAAANEKRSPRPAPAKRGRRAAAGT